MNDSMKSPRFFLFSALLLVFVAAGCGTFRINPVTDEVRQTYPVKDESIYVVVKEGMTFDDSKSRTYSILVPPGTYKLEARDDGYLYFATTGLITLYIYEGKTLIEQDVCKGGLMLGRRLGMLVPAGVYKDDGSLDRVMIWMFDDAFMKLEGKKWELHQPDGTEKKS
jgi:hypothetical protein